jgi:hypothetical protein
MKIFLSVYWVLIAAIWYFGNGVLHDIFVLKNHAARYDRALLRLLMDGHVLILSGIIVFVCFFMMLNKIRGGALICIIVATGMLIYCAMIFPFLKSFGTIIISIMLLIASVNAMNGFAQI